MENIIDFEEKCRNEVDNKVNKDKHYRSRFLINKGIKFQSLNIQYIAYFVYTNNSTYAVCFNKSKYIINCALDKITKEIDSSQFFRVNRQCIINIAAFDFYENYFAGRLIVKLINNLSDPIIVSKTKAKTFKEWLNT